MDDRELVLTAAAKYGFNLEFKAKDIFEKKGFQTEPNKLLKLNNELLEIDLVAKLFPDRPFVVECKGTDSNSFLILVKESSNLDMVDTYKRIMISGTNYRLIGFEQEESLFCTFTGDFFNCVKGKELTKSSKNNEENNFYKAQLQMIDAICALTKIDFKQAVAHITPLIITNAKIWVVDYNSPEFINAIGYKWVLHKVKSNAKLRLVPRETEEVLSFVIPIVNINYLSDFLDKAKFVNDYTGCINIFPESVQSN